MPRSSSSAEPLRVCADPHNPPFSQRDETGFENRIASLLADALQRPLAYTWLLDRRGFVRKTLGAGLCDLIVGLPVGFPQVRSSQPYYRSAFYFVGRRDGPGLASFEDPRLAQLRIGVQLVGIDPGTSPVGYALARHGAVERVVGFTLGEDQRTPAERMVEAVSAGRLDSALLWGP
jgi:mxaJ protein